MKVSYLLVAALWIVCALLINANVYALPWWVIVAPIVLSLGGLAVFIVFGLLFLIVAIFAAARS